MPNFLPFCYRYFLLVFISFFIESRNICVAIFSLLFGDHWVYSTTWPLIAFFLFYSFKSLLLKLHQLLHFCIASIYLSLALYFALSYILASASFMSSSFNNSSSPLLPSSNEQEAVSGTASLYPILGCWLAGLSEFPCTSHRRAERILFLTNHITPPKYHLYFALAWGLCPPDSSIVTIGFFTIRLQSSFVTSIWMRTHSLLDWTIISSRLFKLSLGHKNSSDDQNGFSMHFTVFQKTVRLVNNFSRSSTERLVWSAFLSFPNSLRRQLAC